ncbi:MAG: class I SAM-dependent methyltransferase, partial [Lachnospiraceae bacterium]|nr:class I SAM-dependent methyltransferase [Lachnospiraceae bacterium]
CPDTLFDRILVYNAFPHFPDGDRLIAHLTTLLAPGGTLSVAHGMSRDAINAHHSGRAKAVSVGLMSETELAEIFSKYLKVTTVISNSEMYQVAGTKIPQ